jgi:glucose-6-phosphate isomerase
MPQPTTTPDWTKLSALQKSLTHFSLRDELKSPSRFADFSMAESGVLFDFSKHIITADVKTALLSLAKTMQVETLRDKMFAGEKINNTENRAVLHTALRAPKDSVVMVDGENVIPFVHQVLDQMKSFADAVRSGAHTGYTGKPITDIINIGIGGSDLGPRFVVDALADFCSGPKVHFVSNVDGFDITTTLKKCSPETTLFIVASKTFTTEETMLNAEVAKDWLLRSAPKEAIAKHFVALSTNRDDVLKFGILEQNMFPFREWVGGRYSLWSAIGLSIALAIGFDNFRALLDGAHTMDTHFKTAPLDKNIPVMMGVVGVWYTNFWNYPAHLLLAYDTRLGKIAKFNQQMDMESNGKAVDRDGTPVTYATGPVLFGEPGTDSQHSFMQLVHQSPTPIPADFIIAKKPSHPLTTNHQSLMANYLAQTRALAIGQTLDEAGGDQSRVFSGNRPSTSIILPELTPFTLGLLIAAYEHKVFVQGIIWNLNSYDQPGVELGKKLAKPLRALIENKKNDATLDVSTQNLLKYLI